MNVRNPERILLTRLTYCTILILSRSFIIGDHPSDIQCGLNAGITPIYLLTGHGKKHQNEINKETVICSNLLEASKHIILKNNQI